MRLWSSSMEIVQYFPRSSGGVVVWGYFGNCAVLSCLSGHFHFGYGLVHFRAEHREKGRAEQHNIMTAVASHG